MRYIFDLLPIAIAIPVLILAIVIVVTLAWLSAKVVAKSAIEREAEG